jgi:hypothetical protein
LRKVEIALKKKPGGRAKGETDNRKVNEEKEAQTGVHRRAAADAAAGDIISKHQLRLETRASDLCSSQSPLSVGPLAKSSKRRPTSK